MSVDSVRGCMFRCIAVIVAVTTIAFHGVTSLLWYYESRRAGGSCGGAGGRERNLAWIREAVALLAIVFIWPLGWLGRRMPRVRGGSRPVVLVHGWSLNRASMVVVAARLRRDGREAYAINYPSMHASMDEKASRLAAMLREIAAAGPDGRVDVVAHSQGGVVVRAAARFHGVAPLLGNLVTLGAPHRGTALALLWGGAGLAALRPGARFLEDLAHEDDLPASVNVTAIASVCDAIVFPIELAYYPGALNVTVDHVGHHAMLCSNLVYRLMKENLDLPSRENRT